MPLSRKRALWHALLYFAGVRRRRPARATYRQIAIFKVDRLGDFVLATGAIRAVVEQYGADRCVLVVSTHAAELARREFPGVELVVIEAHFGKLEQGRRHLRSLRDHPLFSRGVDRLVNLRQHRTPYLDLAFSAIPAGETTGLDASVLSNFEGELFQSRLVFDRRARPAPAMAGECHELSAYRGLLEIFLGRQCRPDELIPRIKPPARTNRGRHLLVAPFSSVTTRDMGPEFLGKILLEVQRTSPRPIRLVASPTTEIQARALVASLTGAGVKQLEVVLTPQLEALLEEMAGAAVCLLPETATTQLAVALDLPAVCLLGGGHHGWFGPWSRSRRQRWVTHPMDCYGCNWHCRHPEAYCLTRIPPSQVAAELLSLLAQYPGYGLTE